MAKKTMSNVMDLVKGLSKKEQQKLVDKILGMLNTNEKVHSARKTSVEKPDCPYCQAKANMRYIVKKGFHGDVQRFYCKNCKRTFVSTTNTTFARSRKGMDVWKKFIKLTIAGASIRECAEECELSQQTAFTWRHKILNVFKVSQNNIQMAGQIQMDELLIPISYKGNHYKGFHSAGTNYRFEKNPLPRDPYKRGTDNKSMSSKDKACVFCMVENGNKGFYATVPGVGFMKNDMLDQTVGKHVRKDKSLVIADQYKVTAKYLERNNYKHMILAANVSDNYKDHKPEIRGKDHLQHVNSMHRFLRHFLKKYCGVSTKYLENYVSLFIWLKNIGANKQKKKVQEVTIARASSADCYISRKALESLPAIPHCA